MVNLINEELFRPTFGNYRAITGANFSDRFLSTNWENIYQRITDSGFYFFRKDDFDFVYIPKMETFLVPEDSNITKDVLLNETVNVDDWVFEKINNEPDPNYIINWYKRSSTELYCSAFKQDVPIIDKFRQNEGMYKISNETLNYEKIISIKVLSEFHEVDSVFVCYPEKTAPKIQKEKIRKFENFLSLLIWIKMKP